MTDELVACVSCGKEYKRITASHFKKHGIKSWDEYNALVKAKEEADKLENASDVVTCSEEPTVSELETVEDDDTYEPSREELKEEEQRIMAEEGEELSKEEIKKIIANPEEHIPTAEEWAEHLEIVNGDIPEVSDDEVEELVKEAFGDLCGTCDKPVDMSNKKMFIEKNGIVYHRDRKCYHSAK